MGLEVVEGVEWGKVVTMGLEVVEGVEWGVKRGVEWGVERGQVEMVEWKVAGGKGETTEWEDEPVDDKVTVGDSRSSWELISAIKKVCNYIKLY